MSTTDNGATSLEGDEAAMKAMQEKAKRHLWMHFSRMGAYEDHEIPVIVRGEGPYVWDQRGKRYIDGLAGLFTSQLGHGRTELAEAAGKQASELAYFPIWTYAHPKAIELADRLAGLAPGDLNRVFFTGGGSEAVESLGSSPASTSRRSASRSGPKW
jgi:adenosylmethionine-8-amino-7-oxononanoate aminotransferase